VTRVRDLGRFISTVASNITNHHTMLVASGVAFSCVIGLLPALIVLVSVYGLIASPSDVESNLRPLAEALPSAAGELLVEQLQNVTAIDTTEITLSLLVGLVGMAWAVSGAMNAIVMAVRIAHEMPSPHNWVQGRLFALRLSMIGVLATVAMIWLAVALPPILERNEVGSAFDRALSLGRWPLVVLTSMAAFALLYRAVVGSRSGNSPVISAGAMIGTITWALSTYLLSLIYDNVGRLEGTFGSLGAVAALMGWLYFSAFSALLGAEVDGVIYQGRHKRGRSAHHRPDNSSPTPRSDEADETKVLNAQESAALADEVYRRSTGESDERSRMGKVLPLAPKLQRVRVDTPVVSGDAEQTPVGGAGDRSPRE